jgi:hypothetical protein
MEAVRNGYCEGAHDKMGGETKCTVEEGRR